MVVKKHPLDITKYRSDNPNVIVESKFSSLEWMAVSDAIITDYSAISIEGALLGKKIYIYQPDLEEYIRDVGINVDYREESLSRYFFQDAVELTEALDKEYDMKVVEEFLHKYLDVSLHNCTERLIQHIREILDMHKHIA